MLDIRCMARTITNLGDTGQDGPCGGGTGLRNPDERVPQHRLRNMRRSSSESVFEEGRENPLRQRIDVIAIWSELRSHRVVVVLLAQCVVHRNSEAGAG